jgi:glycolate oxidase iron-sulfur subunit
MHAHSGDKETAIALAKQNIEAFSESRVNAVVFNSSGCGSFLSEYEKLLELDDDLRSPKLIRSIMDVMTFLETIEWPTSPMFRINRIKVAVHEPCTQRNHLKNQDAIYRLLKKIPGLEVIPLPENNICCGAGGTKMITQPEMAEPLRNLKVKALLDSDAKILLSSNMSCAMHLASGIHEAGREIEVLHPIQLLARQLV